MALLSRPVHGSHTPSDVDGGGCSEKQQFVQEVTAPGPLDCDVDDGVLALWVRYCYHLQCVLKWF